MALAHSKWILSKHSANAGMITFEDNEYRPMICILPDILARIASEGAHDVFILILTK